MSEGSVEFGPMTALARMPEDPYRVEIKENSKGEASVSVRATHADSVEAVAIAVRMYMDTRRELGLDRG